MDAGTPQNLDAVAAGLVDRHVEQSRLADPGLAVHQHGRRPALAQVAKQAAEQSSLPLSSHEGPRAGAGGRPLHHVSIVSGMVGSHPGDHAIP